MVWHYWNVDCILRTKIIVSFIVIIFGTLSFTYRLNVIITAANSLSNFPPVSRTTIQVCIPGWPVTSWAGRSVRSWWKQSSRTPCSPGGTCPRSHQSSQTPPVQPVVKLLSNRRWIPTGARLEAPKLDTEVGFPTADQGFSCIQGTLFGFRWDLSSVWRLQHLSTPSMDKYKWQNDREWLHFTKKIIRIDR